MPRLIDPVLIDSLAAALADRSNELQIASVQADLDPISLVRAGSATSGWAGYFSSPAGVEMAGIGVAWRTAASGPNRLLDLDTAIRARGGDLPVMVGFSFSPHGPRLAEWNGFAPAGAVLPLVSVMRRDGATRLTVVVPPGRASRDILEQLLGLVKPSPLRVFEAADHVVESRPAPAAWRSAVGEAIGTIRAGSLEKVVLARSVSVRTDVPARPFDLASQLRSGYPYSFTFGWQEGDSAFVGASPELLVSRAGLEISTNPLAGSTARGKDDHEDIQLGHALAVSRKDRREHVFVVEDIRTRLAPLVDELTVPTEPVLRKFPTVQHLSTEITGRLSEPTSVVELADVLHPTPAVGGTPRDDSLLFLDKIEEIDRGWYAGGIGWCDPSGDGEVAVALRCGLLRGSTAYLFAGAGIVADSDPDEELFETRLKFRPMLDLLSAT
ncbi:MAG: isochorismate synthase [Acidimicrobiia bacterium]|nr:isochorismate synthase [Acidimicrobiia bacterium]